MNEDKKISKFYTELTDIVNSCSNLSDFFFFYFKVVRKILRCLFQSLSS